MASAQGEDNKGNQKTGIFFKTENIGNIFRQNAHYGLLAVLLQRREDD